MNKKILKNVLSIISIPIFGFILLNITFLVYAVLNFITIRFIGIIVSSNPEIYLPEFHFILRFCFVLIILLISYFIFKSKIKTIFKAIFLVVPTATILVIMGIFLYQWPIISYIFGFILVSSAIYYFYKKKQPWIYYYSIILISVVLAIFTATGGEI